MHTALAIVAGLLLAAAFGLLGYVWGGGGGAAAALRVFLLAWLAASGIHLWVGVTRAGYPLPTELPIAALVFALPALAALSAARTVAS